MITREHQKAAQKQAAQMIRKAGITITDKEANSIEVVDFGLSNLAREGVQVLTLVQTERISVKVLAIWNSSAWRRRRMTDSRFKPALV